MSNDHRLFLAGLVLSWAACPLVPRALHAEAVPSVGPGDEFASGKLHPALLRALDETTGPVKTWVFFADKGIRSQAEYDQAIQRVASSYNPRAVWRRALRGDNARRGGALFDYHDLPVIQDYIDAVVATGATLKITSHWVNAVSVYATREQLHQIARLPCVSKLQPVARAAKVTLPTPPSR